MKIIKFEEKYRDDMIYMVLSAKNALGRIPKLNEDLLDIQANYFNQKQSLESHSFYTKHGYKEYQELYRKKQL